MRKTQIYIEKLWKTEKNTPSGRGGGCRLSIKSLYPPGGGGVKISLNVLLKLGGPDREQSKSKSQ